MSSWMRVRLRMSHGDATQLLKTSRLARALPETSLAWQQGRLSSGQIRVVVANLVLLCSKHHHLIHRRGWHITMDDTGVLEVTAPAGTTRRSNPDRKSARLNSSH